MLSLPLTTDQSQTTEQIRANLKHIRNVLAVIQGDCESLSGCILALSSDALNILAPVDNLQEVADDLGAIVYEVYTGLGLSCVRLISGQQIVRELIID